MAIMVASGYQNIFFIWDIIGSLDLIFPELLKSDLELKSLGSGSSRFHA